MNCVADDRHRRPLADRGSPGRTYGNAVTNPRIRVCSTVVLTALSPALRNRSILLRPLLPWDRTLVSRLIDTEHQNLPSALLAFGALAQLRSADLVASFLFPPKPRLQCFSRSLLGFMELDAPV